MQHGRIIIPKHRLYTIMQHAESYVILHRTMMNVFITFLNGFLIFHVLNVLTFFCNDFYINDLGLKIDHLVQIAYVVR